MKSLLTAVTLTVTLCAAACASMNGGEEPGLTYNTVYYDGHYGSLYSGFWGPDHRFYYATGAGKPHFRDAGAHVRPRPAIGFHELRIADHMHTARAVHDAR
jgi:hypothetical protein